MRTWLAVLAVLVIFCNLEPGTYVGECDNEPITFEVDASGAIGVECTSIHAVLVTSGGITVSCEAVTE